MRHRTPILIGEQPQGPAIVLVEPQLGENIGAAARAMLNCGLTDLRLVQPRDGWPSARAAAAATGAVEVVERARTYPSTGAAVEELELVFATTSRLRDMRKTCTTPRQAALEMRAASREGTGVGVLFGPERTGLRNDDLTFAQQLLHIPLNPQFSSLNLAQAVLLVAYEWVQASGCDVEPAEAPPPGEAVATLGALQHFFAHLEQELDHSGFLRVREKRAIMVRNLRNLFLRAELKVDEVRTLHGIVSALSGRRRDGSPVRSPRPKGSVTTED